MTSLPQTEGVEYREITGYPGYAVGDDGTVWSRRKSGSARTLYDSWHPLTLRPAHECQPYMKALLHDGKKPKLASVHTLVLTAFAGVRPTGLVCRHLDGNPLNNRLGNLAWGTYLENRRDMVLHGTQRRGEQASVAKLTESQVREIRGLEKLQSATKTAKQFGLSKSGIRKIQLRQTWAHVP